MSSEKNTVETKRKFFVLSRDEPTKYSKFKLILETDGWISVDWIQDVNLLQDKLKDLDLNDNKETIACLTLIKPPKLVGGGTKRDENALFELIKRYFPIENHSRSLLLVANGTGDNDNDNDDDSDNYQADLMLNRLLSELKFNVRFRNDYVIGMSPLSMDMQKLYHPKEVKLTSKEDQFIVNRGLSQFISEQREFSSESSNISMLYPYGCTLNLIDNVSKYIHNHVVVMMISGQAKNCLPRGQPICAFYEANMKNQATSTRIDSNSSSFKAILFGSSRMLTNEYIELEDNYEIVSSFVQYLSFDKPNGQQHRLVINLSDANTLEIEPKFHYTPHIETILNYPLIPMPKRSNNESPSSSTSQLFDAKKTLFELNNSMLGKLKQAYEDLNVERGPLSLIKPRFECQSLPLEPAVHKFLIRRL